MRCVEVTSLCNAIHPPCNVQCTDNTYSILLQLCNKLLYVLPAYKLVLLCVSRNFVSCFRMQYKNKVII
jgi:hypothetical protein